MKFLNPAVTHPSFIGLCLRFFRISSRYGLSPRKAKKKLELYLAILQKHNIVPTFPITAKVLKRCSGIIKRLADESVDLAVHGYEHIDYAGLTQEIQRRHLEEATSIFLKNDVAFSGFRTPYLSYNDHTFEALKECELEWDSSQAILWDVFDEKNPDKRLEWQKALSIYNYLDASQHVSLPHLQDNFVEIPVSLPDDDILLDRISNNNSIYKIWPKILNKTYENGELFTLQLHPERIKLCKDALESLLEKTSKHNKSPIWIAPLSEIASWWKERNAFSFNITGEENDCYHVEAMCSERGVILVKNVEEKNATVFFNGYKIMRENNFSLTSSARPVIGVSTRVPQHLLDFLKNEGFLFEISDEKDSYGIYFDSDMNVQENEREVLSFIEQSPFPIIRFWRWPEGARSALSITGDIDAMTLTDFCLRLFRRNYSG